jgi:hypothetical protein
MEKLDEIPIKLGMEELKGQLRISDPEQVQALVEAARPVLSAKAVYGTCYVEEKLEDAVIIDGVRFQSRVLRKNLDHVGRVFPYLVTIGDGLEERIRASADLLEQYYLDAIANLALGKARKHLGDHLSSRFALDGLSTMSPGSLADWPIEEQRALFSILKGAEASIGVELTESLVMVPRKSISGIYFPAEVTFYSCQLCPRENCEARKTPYSEDLARQYKILE